MVNRGDIVSGLDEYDRSVSGELYWTAGDYGLVQTTIYAHGRLWPGPCVRVLLKSCSVVTPAEDREENYQQYFERIKAVRQRIADRELKEDLER